MAVEQMVKVPEFCKIVAVGKSDQIGWMVAFETGVEEVEYMTLQDFADMLETHERVSELLEILDGIYDEVFGGESDEDSDADA